jgi:NAD(P)-dependent dehydrogenase (short-subunit alcohol dehydrogenase family)
MSLGETSRHAEKPKIAVVTGGTRGIGRAVSLNLARDGYRVFALYGRDREAADALLKDAAAQDLTAETIRGDLTRPERFSAVVDEIRAKATHVDAIVHCAASGVHRDAAQLSVKHLTWTFGINVFAIHSLIHALLDLMPHGSRIVGITSAGGVRVVPYYAAVGSSKAALESLFRHYASELAPKGIAVNLVCPGLVLTDALDAFPDRDARLKRSIEATPTGRLTTPEDVAQVVTFLVSLASSQIIGQTIVIDGGKALTS